jgi:hypothetical protein
MYQDIQQLQVVKKAKGPQFVYGTAADVENLADFISQKLGNANITEHQRDWRADFWYNNEMDMDHIEPPSDALEAAFTGVVDLFLRNQTAWDNADHVEEADDDDLLSDENSDIDINDL